MHKKLWLVSSRLVSIIHRSKLVLPLVFATTCILTISLKATPATALAYSANTITSADQSNLLPSPVLAKLKQSGKLTGNVISVTMSPHLPATMHSSPSPQFGCVGSANCWYLRNVSNSYDSWGDPNSGAYYICNTLYNPSSVTQTFNVSVNVGQSVSNTFTANVGISAGKVSAGVGFNTTATNTLNLMYTIIVNVPPGQQWAGALYAIYSAKNFEVWQSAFIGNDFKVGSGTAYNWKQAFGSAVYQGTC